jgi:hypothetical protein
MRDFQIYFSLDVTRMSAIWQIAVKIIGGIVVPLILVPIVVVDRHEYWSSFWWRVKRLASVTAHIGSIIGASASP